MTASWCSDPSRAFLRYIAQVLPSLGEEAVVQTTIGDIAPKAKVRAEEPMAVRRIKGDARMGELLRRALEGRRRPLEEDVSLRVRFARATLDRERVNDLVASIVARPGPYKSGRLALRSRLVSEARAAFRSSGRLGADEAWFEGELTSSEEFGALLDTLWPSVSPTTLVRDLLSSREQLERYASGLFSPGEWQLLLRSRGSTVSSTAWSADDLALLDEAAFLTGGRTRSYGHIVVDEAQDLTPMQFRMIARRAPSGSVTVLGDLAQATGPWTYADWDEVRSSPARRRPAPSRRADAGLPGTGPRLGLRLPPAARGRSRNPAHLLHTAGPHRPLRPSRARERAGGRPHWRRPPPWPSTTPWWRSSSPRTSCPRSPGSRGETPGVGVLERDAMTRPVTIVPAPAAKGLEFDAVVVVEPAAIAGDDRRGLRLLYVAMTRPIQHLSVVHAQPLPAPLLG